MYIRIIIIIIMQYAKKYNKVCHVLFVLLDMILFNNVDISYQDHLFLVGFPNRVYIFPMHQFEH